MIKPAQSCAGVGGGVPCLPSGLLSVYTVLSTWKLLEMSTTYPHPHPLFVLLRVVVTSGIISVKTPQTPGLPDRPVLTFPDHCPHMALWGWVPISPTFRTLSLVEHGASHGTCGLIH